jgi:hypothetical protein
MALVIDNVVVEGLVDHSALRSAATVTTASASTLSLTVASTMLQIITGSVAGQIVKLPDATTLTIGYRYEIWNQTTVNVTVNDNASGVLSLMGTLQRGVFVLQAAGSAAGTWAYTVSTQSPTSSQQLQVTYPGSGLAVNFTAGVARYNGTTTQVAAGTITLGASVTNGWIYVDIDGVVKSGASLPNNVMAMAMFTTSGSAVTALVDEREDVDQNLVWGVVGDIIASTYDRAASAGVLEKYARADHAHANNALLNRAGVVAAGTFSGNPKKATVTFTTAMPSATYAVKITSGDSRTCTYESRTTAGFVINLNANTAPSNDVSWEAVITGEAT